ncbi:MAG: WecB/TagA/CpsF family glycosyltransferase [Alphaproteobacteria bacterium]|nr:WecB/TagA/CpsF family glycosyltransferase [Alphaproteobacteria bacterium]
MAGSNRPGDYAAVWPQGAKTVPVQPLAARLQSLEGKIVAQLWDYMFRGDEIFPLLEQALKERFPGVRFVPYDTFGSTHGDEEREIIATLPEKLKALGVDAVISGMGC